MKKIIIIFSLTFSLVECAQQKTIFHTSPGSMKEVLDPSLAKLDSVTRKFSNINGNLYEVTRRFYTSLTDSIGKGKFNKNMSYHWEEYLCDIPKDLRHLTDNELQKMVIDGDNCVIPDAFPNREYNFLYAPRYAKHYTFDGYDAGFQFHWRTNFCAMLTLHATMIGLLLILLFAPIVVILFPKKVLPNILKILFSIAIFIFLYVIKLADNKSYVYSEILCLQTWLNLVNVVVVLLFSYLLIKIGKSKDEKN